MQRKWHCLVAVGCLALASCGGSSSSSPGSSPPSDTAPSSDQVLPEASTTAPPEASTTAPAPTTTAEPTTTLAPGPTAATSLEEVKSAVVRIVGTGSFADPGGGVQANVPGSGSGFIIDPDGLAVTNNHVVTGAAKIEVFLAGEDTPRNARVLGVSECSDLAVIQIDGSGLDGQDGFDYLAWHDEPIAAGAEVFAAGFPLGDSEYTVLDGIVSKESAAGETSWASVDAVIEHSADTLPGSSGGPIVAADGTVIAVNYAGNELGQSFAIGPDVARPIVEQLAADSDVDSVGINGEAFSDGVVSGLWVYSVQSGSPADVAGVRAGDIVLTLESIQLAVDGTMSDYCDVLRSHLPTDTMAIEVYRLGDDQIYEGQLNGRSLEAVTSFATEVDDAVPEATDDSGVVLEPPTYSGYVEVTDDSNLITVTVPAEWSDTDGRMWESTLATGELELIGPALTATPSIDGFIGSWGTPGVFIGASAMIPLTVEEVLDQYWFGDDCLYEDRYPYDDGSYTGFYDVYIDCGAEGSTLLQVVAEPPDQTWIASVQIVALSQADLEAADEIFRTFVVQPLAG